MPNTMSSILEMVQSAGTEVGEDYSTIQLARVANALLNGGYFTFESAVDFEICDTCVIAEAIPTSEFDDEREIEVSHQMADGNIDPGYDARPSYEMEPLWDEVRAVFGEPMATEDPFSWRSCGCCGTSLGGARHPREIWIRSLFR